MRRHANSMKLVTTLIFHDNKMGSGPSCHVDSHKLDHKSSVEAYTAFVTRMAAVVLLGKFHPSGQGCLAVC